MAGLTKRHAKALERVFDAEITGALSHSDWPAYPVRLGPKVAEELRALGYVEHVSFKACGNGRSVLDRVAMTIEGWVLTHAGRYAYCSWTAEHPGDDYREALAEDQATDADVCPDCARWSDECDCEPAGAAQAEGREK